MRKEELNTWVSFTNQTQAAREQPFSTHRRVEIIVLTMGFAHSKDRLIHLSRMERM